MASLDDTYARLAQHGMHQTRAVVAELVLHGPLTSRAAKVQVVCKLLGITEVWVSPGLSH